MASLLFLIYTSYDPLHKIFVCELVNLDLSQGVQQSARKLPVPVLLESLLALPTGSKENVRAEAELSKARNNVKSAVFR